jgi:multisubunit Na+/H+ antiporter MnhG subunit
VELLGEVAAVLPELLVVVFVLVAAFTLFLFIPVFNKIKNTTTTITTATNLIIIYFVFILISS